MLNGEDNIREPEAELHGNGTSHSRWGCVQVSSLSLLPPDWLPCSNMQLSAFAQRHLSGQEEDKFTPEGNSLDGVCDAAATFPRYLNQKASCCGEKIQSTAAGPS
ncbi:hypothetical protein FQA47_024289 [Oryzias melastigma]|uniref:Uncharacterized protein n=1 Tax=Oryzias melastigma TaxID=30732 RepID=A0A834BXQ5_ORYME|nr:hypothetical protein FQA47_024289 [Oryzias melastigma]